MEIQCSVQVYQISVVWIFTNFYQLIQLFILIAVYIKGIHKLWIIGDDFGFKSFNKYYCEQITINHYAKDNFEISGFNNDRKQSYNANIFSRMRNCLMGALCDQILLPQYIVIVLDGDVIHYCNSLGITSYGSYCRVIKWLTCQFNRLIAPQHEYLPGKSKKADEP